MLPCCAQNPSVCALICPPDVRSTNERDLLPWQPEGDPETLMSLEEDVGTGWDQFAVNREKFGIESSFHEEVYTKPLDKTHCPISESEAARIAWEIEKQAPSNALGGAYYHLLEERGGELTDTPDVSRPCLTRQEANKDGGKHGISFSRNLS